MGWFSSSSSSSSSSPASSPPKQQPAEATSQDGTYTPMKRNERQACWESRDLYFGCLDKSDILDPVKDADAAKSKCPKEDALFEKDCATSWVKYFKQKRVADYNKQQQLNKLEKEGAIPMGAAEQGSKWKLW